MIPLPPSDLPPRWEPRRKKKKRRIPMEVLEEYARWRTPTPGKPDSSSSSSAAPAPLPDRGLGAQDDAADTPTLANDAQPNPLDEAWALQEEPSPDPYHTDEEEFLPLDQE